MSGFLKLHPKDNVQVALGLCPAGTAIKDGIVAETDITMAHKVADAPIKKGADVVKYGMVIGVATCDIQPGQHVHVHNIASNYTATHFQEDRANG